MPDNPAQTLTNAAQKVRKDATNDEFWTAVGGTPQALVHPSLAPDLANWLKSTADEMTAVDGTEYRAVGDGHDFASWNAALAVARQILGEAES